MGAYCWPGGFYADINYQIDIPVILNPKNPGYNFDKVVTQFYEQMVEHFTMERSNHIIRPFGCDLAYVDASINFKINDRVIEVWKELGYDKEIELRYSTPTKYVQAMKEFNDYKNQTIGKEWGWPERHDDYFPYAMYPDSYWTGYFSSRPNLKKNIRDFTIKFHAGQRLLAEQMLRQDANPKDIQDLLFF